MPESPADDPAETAPASSPPPAAPHASAAATKRQVFGKRSLSTVCLVGILALAVWLSQFWIYALLFAVLSFGALTEYFRLFRDDGFRRFLWQTYGVGAVYIALLLGPLYGFEPAWRAHLDGLATGALVMLLVLAQLRSPIEGSRTLEEIAAAVFGFIYCVVLFGFVAKIMVMPLETAAGGPAAAFYLVYLVAVTKLTDMGAYIVGSLIGRDKMAPHVSPGKTWQGFGGALAFAVAGSYALYFLMGDQIPLITPLHAGLVALLLALAAVLGDLAESILKRSLEAKDSGHLMPGIGGFLDLVDSVIFTAPLFYLYLVLVG